MKHYYSFFILPILMAMTCILITETANSQGWYDPDWQYRRPITVANPGGIMLTDYQVLITLNNDSLDFTNTQVDGSDIRITDTDGITLISFWIENWNFVTQQAIIWTKVPSIPTEGTTVYLYYGNLAATSASSAANTFIFGADFEDGTIGGLTVNTVDSAVVNVPLAPSQYMYGTKVDGWVKQPNPVLPKRPGKWDDYGTREIAPIISESDGKVEVGPDGKISAYYMGISTAPGHPMAIGITKSSDGGYMWDERLDNPVIGPSGVPGSWYQWSVQQSSVLRRSSDSLLMMMAAGWTSSAYTSGSMGVFTSTDGVNWTDQGQKLTLSQFHYDASNGIDQMGAPSIVKRSIDGDYFLLFDANKSGASGRWRIFAATSSDFTGTWIPYNGGYPVFQETGSGWESWGVANPRIVEMSPNQFVMTYSGTAGSNWRIGFASTTDFANWTRYAQNPVLGPSLPWDVTHTETSFLVKTDIGSVGQLYFQGFDGFGAPQVGLATNSPGEPGKVLHANSPAVAAGWVVGTTLDATSPFIWEFLTQTPTDPINVSSGLEIGLGNWAGVPVPMDNGMWHAHDGINIQRLAGNSSNPGKFIIMYTATGGSPTYFWNGSGWQSGATWFGGPGLYKVRIWDDGTNYKADLINTTSGTSVLPNIASIAKTSVRLFDLGRVIEVSEPFTNYYALDANFDNWIVRKLADNEPSINVGDESQLLQSLNLKIYLEGAFNGTDMDTYLTDLTLLPSNQPYNTEPWNYEGTETLPGPPNTNVAEWVLVELRDASDAASATTETQVARQAALLLNNGMVVGVDGISTIQINTPILQQAYVVIWHRNHLGIMSANSLTIDPGSLSTYDFTTAVSQAYGDGQNHLGNQFYGMTAGDANADGIINLSDVVQTWIPQAGSAGYLNGDTDLDGQVNNPDKNDWWLKNLNNESQVPE
jgi:hypothetical protein